MTLIESLPAIAWDARSVQERLDRADAEAYLRDWLEAHGYLPRTVLPPLPPAHWCPTQYGYLVHGSRADCPHCKIAAPKEER